MSSNGETVSSSSSFFQGLKYLKVNRLSEIHVILFGFAMIMGNCTYTWNAGLKIHGIYALWFNLLFAASGFFSLCLCMGEMSSALPFSGGVFGFVRVALGPFFGFMVASCEFLLCIVGISLRAQLFWSHGSGRVYDAGMVIALFGFCLLMNLMGGKPVFVLTSLIGFFTVMMLVVYLCGTLNAVGTDAVSYTHYSPPIVELSWFHVMTARPVVGGVFNAVQFLPLLSEYMKEPRDQLPRVLLISCASFLLMTVFVILAAVSQNPGAKSIQVVPSPLRAGFIRIFHIKDLRNIQWFDLPYQLGPIFCLFYCAGKQLLALSKSGLLPPVFSKVIPGSEAPYVCYTFTAVVAAGMNIIYLFNQEYIQEIRAINSTVTVTIFVFCSIAFMVFRRMSRSFVNPLGDFSAIYGSVVFISAWIATVFYNPINKMFLVGLAGYWFACAVFFFTYLVHNQKFSEEEKKVMFKAYLINANRKKRANVLRNNKVGIASEPNGSNLNTGGLHSSVNNHGISLQENPRITNDEVVPSKTSNEEKIDEARMTFSQSSRQPEPIVNVSSKKIIAFISSKMNAVVPAISQMNSKDLRDYAQLAVLAAGGIMDESLEEALKARVGVEDGDKDDDNGVAVGNIETGAVEAV